MISCDACNTIIYEEISGESLSTQPISESSIEVLSQEVHDSEYICDSGFIYCRGCEPTELRDSPPEKSPLDALITFFYEQNTEETLQLHKDRGWSDEIVSELRLGWAPPDDPYSAYKYLEEHGYTTSEILSTGVFSNEGSPPYACLWRGRVVFPYYDENMNPIYAIARAISEEGHEKDILAGKYAKLPKNKPHSTYTDSIYGEHSLSKTAPIDENAVIITEGMPDAISAIDIGFPTLSPVTSEFSYDQYDEVVETLADRDFDTIYLVPDNEEVQQSQEERSTDLSVGLEGGLKTTAHIQERDIDTPIKIVQLPRPEHIEKVDLDDYLSEHSQDEFHSLLEDSVNPTEIDEYEEIRNTIKEQIEYREQQRESSNNPKSGSGEYSAIYDLKITDVLPSQFSKKGDRGEHPIQHIGNSRNYFSVTSYKGGLIAHDFKRNVTYSPLTYVLCEIGERDLADPNGPLSNRETWLVWKWCKEQNIIGTEDPVPSKAISYIAEKHVDRYTKADAAQDGGMLPYDVYRDALIAIKEEYGLSPGRDISSND